MVKNILTLLSLITAVNASAQSNATPNIVLNDSWYVMQAGNVPWGYFHELIEKRGDRYSYRVVITKREGTDIYQESIGALANEDLTTVSFNIVKSGLGATEIADGSFHPKDPNKKESGGMMKIKIQGAKNASFSRAVSKGAIFDSFLPVWLSKNWEKLKVGAKGWTYIFTEDPDRQDFAQKTARYEVIANDTQNGCLKIKIEALPLKQTWCLTKQGQIVTLESGRIKAKRVKNEQEAKATLDLKQ